MKNLNLQAIDYQSVSGTIATQIRNNILGGILQPSQPLSESEIAKQLGVSRGPVREALQRLVQEGLLVRIPNRGVFVTDITPEDIAEIYEARQTLEARCGTKVLAADDGALEGTVRELQAIVDEIGPAERSGRWREVVELDLRFHSTLVAASGNSRIQRAYSTLIAESSLSINRLERWYPSDDSLLAEHQAIVDALVARDQAAFTRALDLHYLQTLTENTGQSRRG
ncbi:GntR family transcriptional regulator [Amycolatopsis sp. NPDC051128]|uniref:GntR family transcriptional regulator n=1 Tax=Amycolatopsis sp. NPDC051128 TaxID=3155412 RepID=UPI0034161012